MCGIAGGVFWDGSDRAQRDARVAVSTMVAALAIADRTAGASTSPRDARTTEVRLRFSATPGWRFSM